MKMKFNAAISFIVYHWFSIISISISNELTINNVEQKYIGLPQMATFRNYEEMNEYISRKEDIIYNPLMDSYLAAYNHHHESLNSENNYRITKRSADPYDFIKFELSDAKEPDEAVKQIVRKHRQREEDEYELSAKNKKPEKTVETQNEEISHKIEKRSADPRDLVQFELADAKEPDEAVKGIIKLHNEREKKEIEKLEKEKKLVTIFGTKKKEVGHKIEKRSADPFDFIKFELSDAKEPDQLVKQVSRQHRQREHKSMDKGEKDMKLLSPGLSASNQTNDMETISSDNDQDIHESRVVNFYHPVVQIPVKTKTSMQKFPLPVQKAINLVLSESKHGFRATPVLPPLPQKYYGDKLMENNYKSLEPKVSNSASHSAPSLNYIYPNYHQYIQHYAQQPNYAEPAASHIANDYNQFNKYAFVNEDAGQVNNVHGNSHVLQYGKPPIVAKIVPEVIKYVYNEVPDVKSSRSETSSAAEQALKNYEYLSTSNVLQNELLAKASLANNGYEFSGAGGVVKQSFNDIDGKISYGPSLGNYLQSTSVKDVILQKNSPENNVDAISKYNALTEKSTADQFHGLTYLLQNDIKEPSHVNAERPQDNRAPVLFHPELKGKVQKPKNYYINQYGFKQVHPIADVKEPLNDFKPISEPPVEIQKEQVIHVTPYPPSYKKAQSLSSNYKLPAELNLEGEGFGLKNAYKELLDAKSLQYASKYAFGYRVRDFHTGNDFGHEQNRDKDGVTRGQYHILLPDGRVQNVRYHADDSGFHADVSFETGHDH